MRLLNNRHSSYLYAMRPYALAAIGPIFASGGQFILSIQLVAMLPALEFGSFSFLLIVLQFSFGVSNALLCAPFPVVRNAAQTNLTAVDACFSTANITSCSFAAIIFFAISCLMHLTIIDAAIFAAFAALMIFRWFGRALAYILELQIIVVYSDVILGVALLLGVLELHYNPTYSIRAVLFIILISVSLSLTPFLTNVIRSNLTVFKFYEIKNYCYIWKKHTIWSLLGVITTELTTNAHVYIVTIYSGAAAFAPIAAASLFIRPISLVANALTDFERPRMAYQIKLARIDGALKSVRLFRVTMLSIWFASGVAATVSLSYHGGSLFPPDYSATSLKICVALWLTISSIRALRTGESVLLQAAGEFRLLALATFIASGLTVCVVAAMVVLYGPIWSLVGVLGGEGVVALMIWKTFSRWRNAVAGFH